MRIIFNLLSTLKPRTGVGHYAARLFEQLTRQLPDNAIVGFPGDVLASTIRKCLGQPRAPSVPVPSNRKPGYLSQFKSRLKPAGRCLLSHAFRARCATSRFDLYHEPNFIPLADSLPCVVTVLDLSVMRYPQWHPADRVRNHQTSFLSSIERARHIIAISESVRQELIRDYAIPPARVSAVHCGVGPEYANVSAEDVRIVREELRLPADYLLYVGTIEPRKNIGLLLRAYTALPAAMRSSCPLILAGGWGWKSREVAEFYQREAKHKNVIVLGYTADRYLPGLYAGARALVYPSHYEGFGLPPLEMLATGGAVLSSRAEALREVLGKHAHFTEAEDEAGWHDTLARAITDDSWVASLRANAVRHAARYSWERCARETAQVYAHVLTGLRQAA